MLSLFPSLDRDIAPPETRTSPSHYVSLSFAHSKEVLGTSEHRTGVSFSYGFGRPNRRLRYRSTQAQVVHSIYYFRGSGNFLSESEDALGYSFSGRWPFATNGKVGVYAEVGWGLQYTTNTSRDINSPVNSTPFLGVGATFRVVEGEAFAGIQWFHVSNGGTAPPNHGQNYFNFIVGLRYR